MFSTHSIYIAWCESTSKNIGYHPNVFFETLPFEKYRVPKLYMSFHKNTFNSALFDILVCVWERGGVSRQYC